MKFRKLLDQNEQMYIQEKLILDESLFKEYYYDNNKIEYKPISNIDKFKKYADEILGGYGGMSDSDIKKDIEEIYIDDELKGYIGLSKYNEEDGTKLLGIGNFMIIEQGKGYGTQVIKDIVSKYKNEYDLIYCFVDSDNEGAISLYKKLGKVYDEDGSNDNGQYYVTFYDNGRYKLEESLDQEKSEIYYRLIVTDDKGQDKGGIFRGLNQLLKDLWEEDSEYYDYINDPLSKLEWLTPYPEDIDDIDIKFAYKKSFYNQNKELFEDIEYALNMLDWELTTVKVDEPIKIIYEDDTQIAYLKGVSLEEAIDLSEALYNKNKLKESLAEAKKKKAKKRKLPRLDYTEFNTPVKLKAWIKKRQKGLSPFCYLNPNAGNVEYSNSMFNQMMGSADGASSVGVSDGGISNGGLSAPAGDAGGGMGESFTQTSADNKVKENINNEKFKITSKLNYFIHYNQDLINAEEWDTLFEVAEDELSIDEQACLVEMLFSIGCKFEMLD